MRTCIDRLIAQPRLGGQLVRQESEFIANRLDILRHEGTISNDAYLDSGAIYRIISLEAKRKLITPNQISKIIEEIDDLDIRFSDEKIFINQEDIKD